jgi:hypothetical protein
MLTKGPAFAGGGSGVLGLLLMYWGDFALAFVSIGLGSVVAGIGCASFITQLGNSV